MRADPARLENVLVRESARRDGAATGPKRGISGRLENLGLPDIVQILHIGMKTAAVTLHAGKLTGKLWFEGGAARHAKLGDFEGEAAFYATLRWSEGDFTIDHGAWPEMSRRTGSARRRLFAGDIIRYLPAALKALGGE